MTTTQSADILVVDDDPGTLETLGDILSRQGHRVHAAARGCVALDRLKQSPPVDVAILDFKLPDISGLDLMSSLKATSPETAVILITGHASLPTALEAIEGQASSFLVKPLDLDRLLASVEQALARQRTARALRESGERYRLVADSVTEAVLFVDGNGRLVSANRYAETLTGYGAADLRGRLARLPADPGGSRAGTGASRGRAAGRAGAASRVRAAPEGRRSGVDRGAGEPRW